MPRLVSLGKLCRRREWVDELKGEGRYRPEEWHCRKEGAVRDRKGAHRTWVKA